MSFSTGKKKKRNFDMREHLEIQSMMIIAVVFLLVFAYAPMYGLRIAFQDYNLISGLSGAKWVGLKYFKEFLTDPNLLKVVRNTLSINLLGLIIGFPAPIILALLLNEIRSLRFKKVAQTVSYMPHFLSWVIFGGLALEILSNRGIINSVLVSIGLLKEPINFMAKGENFYLIMVILLLIKSVGYGSILYVAAISGVDQDMYEAATIDGCGRFQKMWYITLPSITGTIVILLIFEISRILNTGYEQIFILQNPLNRGFSETIDTYVYRLGVSQMRYSYAAAVGLLKSVMAVILLVGANTASKKITEKGLF
jgi:putative aldouronate transport system permease protein